MCDPEGVRTLGHDNNDDMERSAEGTKEGKGMAMDHGVIQSTDWGLGL